MSETTPAPARFSPRDLVFAVGGLGAALGVVMSIGELTERAVRGHTLEAMLGLEAAVTAVETRSDSAMVEITGRVGDLERRADLALDAIIELRRGAQSVNVQLATITQSLGRIEAILEQEERR